MSIVEENDVSEQVIFITKLQAKLKNLLKVSKVFIAKVFKLVKVFNTFKC